MEGLRFWCVRVGGDFVMKKTPRWFTVVRELQVRAAGGVTVEMGLRRSVWS